PLVVLQRVLKALGPDFAAAEHPLGLPGRSSLFREERLRICLCAQRLILPAQLVLILWTDEDFRQRDDDLGHSASSLTNSEPPGLASPREDENHTNETTPACLASSQAEKVIVVPSLSQYARKITQRIRSISYRKPTSNFKVTCSYFRRAGVDAGGGGPAGAGRG